MTAKVSLVLGGVRSGKSAFAERLVRESGRPAVYIATGVASDPEMEERIRRHRESRPADWATVEEPLDLGGRLEALAKDWGNKEAPFPPPAVLIDSLDLWVANLMMGLDGVDTGKAEAQVLDALEGVLRCAGQTPALLFLVSSEVGLSLVPPEPLGRRFQDVLGTVNQQVAAAADGVYLVVAGIPTEVKGPGVGRGR
jgi:adenosylcobinamide kinase/adenosylcobinamide-phosphate guanylyltransferase